MREDDEKSHMTFFSMAGAAIEKILHCMWEFSLSPAAPVALVGFPLPLGGFLLIAYFELLWHGFLTT